MRIGVIGLGNMGSSHLKYLTKMDTVDVTAVCDIIPEQAERFARMYGTAAFFTHQELMDSGLVDAVIIAVPHYDHVPIANSRYVKKINS